MIDPENLQHIPHSNKKRRRELASRLREMEGLSREAALMRIHPDYASPETFVRRIQKMLNSYKFQKLKNSNRTEAV